MLNDFRSLPVTAAGSDTVDAINDFVPAFLGYAAGAAGIAAAADADPESPLANGYAAIFSMFLESPEAPALARPYLERATANVERATERERLVVAAARAWSMNDIPQALAVGDEMASRFPGELVVAKTTQYHYFNLGDPLGLLRNALQILSNNPDLAYSHGMAAFAYEQAHMLEHAERSARRAIAIQQKEPWAHHALAHVFLSEGRSAEAREFLEEMKGSWTDLNSFMLTHNWWHLALVLIDQGEMDSVLKHYDNVIWGAWKEYSQDQVGAVSLLARLELAGVDVGNRWGDVGEHLRSRAKDCVQPFLTLQYLYGLGRANLPEADELLNYLRDFSNHAPDFIRSTWVEVAVPAAEGLLAHARGDFESTVHSIGTVLPRLMEIGGSHAQRDLFDQIWLDALMQTGRLALAQRMLEQRWQASPESLPTEWKLAELYNRRGLHQASSVRSRSQLAVAG